MEGEHPVVYAAVNSHASYSSGEGNNPVLDKGASDALTGLVLGVQAAPISNLIWLGRFDKLTLIDTTDSSQSMEVRAH